MYQWWSIYGKLHLIEFLTSVLHFIRQMFSGLMFNVEHLQGFKRELAGINSYFHWNYTQLAWYNWNHYRPETKFAKVMFLHVSVCTRGGVPGQVPPSRYTPWAGTPRAGTPPPPEQCRLGDTGNKRAVRILLECILVWVLSFKWSFLFNCNIGSLLVLWPNFQIVTNNVDLCYLTTWAFQIF